ncbi:MAG TPA: TPM domain-containing protein [Kiloniellales bacterium]|nr:TPM domain-containing protein [Kiloniellales bacterium]
MLAARSLLLGLALAFAAAQATAQDQELPRLAGHVVDEAEVLSPDTEARLIDLLSAHETATGNQVVLVTLSSLRGHDISDFAQRLCRYWQGENPDDHCGVLLVVVPSERAVRIEVADPLAAALPEETRRTIVRREVLPFLDGEVATGIEQGLRGILAALAGGYIPPPEHTPGALTRTLGIAVSFTVAGIYLATLVYALLHRRRQNMAERLARYASDGAVEGASGRW